MKGIILDDRSIEIGMFSPVCDRCKHKIDKYKEGVLGHCKAYPEGIPEVIWTGKNKHRKPFKGDNGIQFEKTK